MDMDLMQNQQNFPFCYLHRHDSALQRAQSSLIATHIREVAVDILRDREEKAQVMEQVYNKGFPEFLRGNLT